MDREMGRINKGIKIIDSKIMIFLLVCSFAIPVVLKGNIADFGFPLENIEFWNNIGFLQYKKEGI